MTQFIYDQELKFMFLVLDQSFNVGYYITFSLKFYLLEFNKILVFMRSQHTNFSLQKYEEKFIKHFKTNNTFSHLCMQTSSVQSYQLTSDQQICGDMIS